VVLFHIGEGWAVEIVIAITGASGVVIGARLLEALEEQSNHLCPTALET
jgi:3-polyprenyl-4-hydroxybenzoate decarboxylase